MYDELHEINQGTINWRCPQQDIRMRWIEHHCKGQILDVGCANGGLLQFLSEEEFEGYIGVDFDRVRIDEAKCTYPDKQFYVLDAAYGLPFADESFDVVVCADMLEHIPYDIASKLVYDLVRVTKERVLLTFPLSDEMQENIDHVWTVTVDKVQELLAPFEGCKVKMKLTEDFIFVKMGK